MLYFSLLFVSASVIAGCSGGSGSGPDDTQATQISGATSPTSPIEEVFVSDDVPVLDGGLNEMDSNVIADLESDPSPLTVVGPVVDPQLPTVVTPVEEIEPPTVVSPVVETAPPIVVEPVVATEPTVADSDQISTDITFDITVPAYQSNALQVRLTWGDFDTTAGWLIDESWQTTLHLPGNIENELIVTFSDDNGNTILGRAERLLNTGDNPVQTMQITADQFNTSDWDDNGNGVSNLDELIAGNSPLELEILAESATTEDSELADGSEGFSFIDVAGDLIHSTSACQMHMLASVVNDLGYIIEQTSTITWPDTDWYQVQLIPNREPITQVFDTVCEGESQCKLLPGRHAVINHTNGERSVLDVPSIDVEDNPIATQLPDATYTSTDPEYAAATTDLTRVQFACENGGSYIRETGNVFFEGSRYRPRNYLFDQCQMTVRTGLIPDDNYVLNGNLETLIIDYRYDGNRNYKYDNFSIVGEDGLEYHVQGEFLRADGYYLPFRQTSSISSYIKKLPGGQIVESLTDVEFSHQSYGGYSLTSQGVVQSEKTGNQQVTIRTELPLNYEIRANSNEVLTPFNGSMEMLAEGGSFLYLNANPVSTLSTFNRNIFSLDLESTAENGETMQGSLTAYRVSGQERNCFLQTRIGLDDFRRSTVEQPIP